VDALQAAAVVATLLATSWQAKLAREFHAARRAEAAEGIRSPAPRTIAPRPSASPRRSGAAARQPRRAWQGHPHPFRTSYRIRHAGFA
jgi:hypothetical protein